MFAFIGQDIEYKSQEIHMQLYKTLLALQFCLPQHQDVCGGFGGGAQDAYCNAAWIR